MDIDISQIKNFLEEFCITADEIVLNKMKELCFLFCCSEEHIVDHWVAFCMSTKKQCISPTLPLLDQMEIEEQKVRNSKTRKSLSKKSTSSVTTPVHTSKDIHRILDTSSAISEMEHDSLFNESDKSPLFSSTRTPVRFTPSRKYGERKGTGDTVCSFGPVQEVDWSQFSDIISVNHEKFALKEGYTFMNEKLRERASILNDMIQASAQLYKDQEWSPIHLPSADSIPVVGRICTSSCQRLDANSLLLQGSQELSSGKTIPLDVTQLKEFSFFPGQIIAGTGMNSLGKKFILQDLIETVRPEFPASIPDLANCQDSLSVVVAVGPFATSDTFSYEPLWDLVKYVKANNPNVIILIGPFVDIKNEAIERGDLNETYDELFHTVVSELIKQTEGLGCKIVLVSSARDAHHNDIYPTPPYSLNPSLKKKLFLASDPCLLNIEGVVFGITATDILFHLGKEEISHPHLPDRLGRLCGHILTQRNFYPLYPPAEGININFLQYELYANLPIMPHVLIVPSDFRYFIKDINGCCCINPERLTKRSSGGTFARIRVSKPSEETVNGSIIKRIQAQILKI